MNNPWTKYSAINPQREDGNRQIENGVFRALMKADLTASEYKIFLAVIDKTWGFNKTHDAISKSQFVGMTGLSESMVKYAIRGLEARKMLIRGSSSIRGQRGTPITAYMLNKYHDTWTSKGVNTLTGGQSIVEKGSIHCPKRGQCITPTKETITKETITKEIPAQKEPKKKAAIMSDDDFLEALKKNPAYSHIDFNLELGKIDAWLMVHPGRQKTRRFLVNWLNRIQKPMEPTEYEWPEPSIEQKIESFFVDYYAEGLMTEAEAKIKIREALKAYAKDKTLPQGFKEAYL